MYYLCVSLFFTTSATFSCQIEIDASDINLVTSQFTQALAEHCRNLTV